MTLFRNIHNHSTKLLITMVLGLCGGVMLSACANLSKEEEKPAEPLPDKLVARVASVHLTEGYALIQRYGRLTLSDNSILYSLGEDGNVANLKVTGERLGQFLAADITSGSPINGDAIYLRSLDEVVEKDNKELGNIKESN